MLVTYRTEIALFCDGAEHNAHVATTRSSDLHEATIQAAATRAEKAAVAAG